MTDISSTSHNNGLKRNGSGASVTQMKNSSTTHSGSMNESITSSTSESFRDPASTSFHGSPAKNLSPKGSGGGLKVDPFAATMKPNADKVEKGATTTTGDQLLKEDRPGWSPKVAAVTSPISPLSEDDEVHPAPQRKFTSAPGLIDGPNMFVPTPSPNRLSSHPAHHAPMPEATGTSGLGRPPTTLFLAQEGSLRSQCAADDGSPLTLAGRAAGSSASFASDTVPTHSKLGAGNSATVEARILQRPLNTRNSLSSHSLESAPGVSPQQGAAPSDPILKYAAFFAQEFHRLRNDLIKPPFSEATASDCIQDLSGEQARQHLRAFYTLSSQFVNGTATQASFSSAVCRPRMNPPHPEVSPAASTHSLPFTSTDNSPAAPQPLGFPCFASTLTPSASQSPSASALDSNPFAVSPNSSRVSIVLPQRQSSGKGPGEYFGFVHPNKSEGGGSGPQGHSGADSGPSSIRIGGDGTTEFLRNLAALNNTFENPAFAASIASLQEERRRSVRVARNAKVEECQEGNGAFEINQYSVLEELGRGTQGCVYLAFDNDKGEFRALKEMRRGLAGSAINDAFKREVGIMKRLRHQNIVTLHEVIDDPKLKHIYLVMQYVEKGPLVKWIGNQHVRCEMIDSWRFQYFARQICAGLSYLHQRRIYHRDIKPENILLGMDDHVYLADFGVAHMTGVGTERRKTIVGGVSALQLPESRPASPRLSPADTPLTLVEAPLPSVVGGLGLRSGEDGLGSRLQSVAPSQLQSQIGDVKGTPAYFAPELITTPPTSLKKLNQAALDVWALGVTCYQLLTGSLPFKTPEDGGYLSEDFDIGCIDPDEGVDPEHEYLLKYPDLWRPYLQAVVEQPIPYLEAEEVSLPRRESGDSSNTAGLGSVTSDGTLNTSLLSPGAESGLPSNNTLSPGGLLMVAMLEQAEAAVAGGSPPLNPAKSDGKSPVPKDWFAPLRGMLIRDPKKRWSLEQVRASIKAMGTLHQIEEMGAHEFEPQAGTKPGKRRLRALVNDTRGDSQEKPAAATILNASFEHDPDSPGLRRKAPQSQNLPSHAPTTGTSADDQEESEDSAESMNERGSRALRFRLNIEPGHRSLPTPPDVKDKS